MSEAHLISAFNYFGVSIPEIQELHHISCSGILKT